MKLFMRYQTLCEALKMNELRRIGKYTFHFFTSHQPCPLGELMWGYREGENSCEFLLFKCCHGNLFFTSEQWRDCYFQTNSFQQTLLLYLHEEHAQQI